MNEITTNEVKSNMIELSLHIFFALTLHRLIYTEQQTMEENKSFIILI